jgi:DNA-binding CsgD family transcriptional regulator/PAS domain-containing protein
VANVQHRASPELEPLLRAIYGGLSEDLSFFHCLEAVGTALGSHISANLHEDYEQHASWMEVTGIIGTDELMSLANDYAARWHGQNLWLNRGLPTLLRRGYCDGDEVVPEKELVQTPYYRHFLIRADIRFGLGVSLWHEGPEKHAVATFNRSRATGAFSPETLAFVGALRPHLVNAYTIFRLARDLDESNRSLRATMDRAPIGMMRLTVDGRIVHANREAERLLAAQSGISRSTLGHLVIDRWSDQEKLRATFRELAVCTNATLTKSMLVSKRRSDVGALVLHLCVLPMRPLVATSAQVIAFLSPLTDASAENLDRLILESVLSFTPTEARVVVELRRCHDLQQVATSLGVSESTVRTHLKHAFSKTETCKQSELLSMVDRVCAAAPHPA